MGGLTHTPQICKRIHIGKGCRSTDCLMQDQLRLIPGAISELFAQVSCSGQITLADRYGLMAAVLDDSLTREERESVDRLLRAIRRGRMTMVDEISALAMS